MPDLLLHLRDADLDEVRRVAVVVRDGEKQLTIALRRPKARGFELVGGDPSHDMVDAWGAGR